LLRLKKIQHIIANYLLVFC